MLPIGRSAGFPEFTRCFIPAFAEKLRLGMELTVAVGAHENTLLQFRENLLPAPGISSCGDPEVFLRGIQMVKLECFYAFLVAAPATLAAHVLDSHSPYLLSTPTNCVDHVRSTIRVAPLLHQLLHTPSQSAALPAELPGNKR